MDVRLDTPGLDGEDWPKRTPDVLPLSVFARARKRTKEGKAMPRDRRAQADAYQPDLDNLYAQSHSHHVSNDRWLDRPHPQSKARPVYNPNAVDADRDLRVQEGTPFERPYKPRFTPNVPKPGPPIPPQKAVQGIPIETVQPVVNYDPAEFLHQGVKAYLKQHPEYDDGEWRSSLADVKADPDTQRVLAATYMEMPETADDPVTNRAYAQYEKEIDQQYDFLVGEMGVTHEVVSYDPYATPEEMIADLRDNHHLYTLATAATGSHGEHDDAQNDKKRAVHDAFGHAASGRGFDRHGEEAAYVSHASMFSALAQRAALTDFRAQNATLIVFGLRVKQKKGLLPVEMTATDYRAKPNERQRAVLDRSLAGIQQATGNVNLAEARVTKIGPDWWAVSDSGHVPLRGARSDADANRLLAEMRAAAEVKENLDEDLIAQFQALISDEPEVKARRRSLASRARYDPNAVDADMDRIVQEGTPFARPAGAKKPKMPDKPGGRVRGAAPEVSRTTRTTVRPGTKPAAGKPEVDTSTHPSGGVQGVRLKKGEGGISIEGRPEGSGTPEDPIAVGEDIELAAKLIAEGKSVRLNQPDQVSTLLEKLADIAADAKSKGLKAPKYNLCQVSVPGTNLFCLESKGIPRVQMPQLSGVVPDDAPAARFRRDEGDPESPADISKPFVTSLKAMLGDEGVKTVTMKASHLRASQNELDGAKVGGMMVAMDKGVVLKGTVFVSRDGYVIDGHHRWAAVVGQDAENGQLGDNDIEVEMIDMDIGAALDFANAFSEAMGIPHAAVGQETGGKDSVGAKKSLFDLWNERHAFQRVCGSCGSPI